MSRMMRRDPGLVTTRLGIADSANCSVQVYVPIFVRRLVAACKSQGKLWPLLDGLPHTTSLTHALAS